MSDKGSGFGGRFNAFGASLRQSAQELSAKAAAQVNEINTKVKDKVATKGDGEAGEEVSPPPDTPTTASLKADNVDKKELLEVLQKMNKKVKALTAIRQQLTSKVETVQAEKDRLKSLVTEEILNGTVNLQEDQDEVAQLQAAWRVVDEQNALALQQLQSEFQKFRIQQEGATGPPESSSWEAEKKDLVERHEKELEGLKDSLQSAHAAELQQLKEQVQSSMAGDADEVEKVKQEAKAELEAFKSKAASAKMAEIEKIQFEAAEAAATNLEAKLGEQKLKHEQEIKQIRLEIARKAKGSLEQLRSRLATEKKEALEANESTQVAELEKKHAADLQALRDEAAASLSNEIEKTRKIAEQEAQAEMEKKLEQLRGELQASHEKEIEGMRTEAAQREQKLGAETSSSTEALRLAEATAGSLREELSRLKEASASKVDSLQTQLDDREKLVAEHETKLSELMKEKSKELATKEEEITQLQEAQNALREQLLSQFAKEKSDLQSEFDRKLKETEEEARKMNDSEKTEATESIQKDYSSKMAAQQQSMQEEMARTRSSLQEEFEAQLQTKLKEAETRSTEELVSLRRSLREHVESGQSDLEKAKADLQNAKETEKSLLVELQEVRDLLEAARSGEDNSAKAMDDTLAKQRASYESMLEQQKSKMTEEINAATAKLQETRAGREETLAMMATVEEKLRQAENNASEANNLVSSLKKGGDEREQRLAGLTDELENAKASLYEKAKALDELAAAKESLQSRLSEAEKDRLAVETTKQQELESLKAAHDAKIAELNAEIEKATSQVASLSSSGTAVDSAYRKLQENYENLQSNHEEVKREASEKATELQNALADRNDTLAELNRAQHALEELRDGQSKELAETESRLEVEVQKLTEELRIKSEEVANVRKTEEEKRSSLVAELKKMQDEVKKTTETTRKMQEDHKRALAEQAATLKSSSNIDSEKVVADTRNAVIAEKNSEIEALKASFTKKLEDSKKKEAAVAQTFSKVKAAYAQKLKTTESELTEKIGRLEEEKTALQQSLSTLEAESSEASKTAKTELEDAHISFEKRLEASLKEKDALVQEIQGHLEESRTSIKEYQERLSEQEKLRDEDGKEKLEALVQELESDHKKQIESMEQKHAADLQELNATIEKIRAEADKEVAEKLEQQKEMLSKAADGKLSRLAEEKEELRKAMETHVDQMTSQFKSKLELSREKLSAEVSKLQQSNQEKDQKLGKFVERLKGLTASTASLRSEHEKSKAELAATEAAKNKLEEELKQARKEMDESLATSSETATSFLELQGVLEREKAGLQTKLNNAETELKTKSNNVEELGGKLRALTTNLNSLVEEKNDLEKRLAQAEKQASKLKDTEREVSELRELINKLKLDLTKNANVVERLQAEKDANERSHGQRTALVGMLEAQLSETNDRNAEINAKLEAALYDLSQKDDLIQSNGEMIRKLEADLNESRNATKKATDALASAPKGPDAKTTKLVESLQKELQTAKQQMVRKSATAQRLVQEKEAECAELRKTNKALQQEVDKGSLSDRRILELAAKQSNRESQQVSEIDIRDRTIERMKEKLLERDGLLASAESQVQEVEGRVEELCRVRRREDVNLDYLKSTVVKYLSLPSGSSERAGLLPVLATLLQFDAEDYKTIEEGKNKLSWWGNIAPTMINAPASNAPPPTPSISAEVSVRRPNGAGDKQTRTTTSLQF